VLTEDSECYRIADVPAYKIFGAGGRFLNSKGFVTLCALLFTLCNLVIFERNRGLLSWLDWPPTVLWAASSSTIHAKNILPREKRSTLMEESIVSILKAS
jgi:hypothetical protein